MKRLLILFMVLGLVGGSVATAEASRSTKDSTPVERTVVGTYGPYPSPVTGCNEPLGYWRCMSVRTRPQESFFTAEVTDTHGLPVFVEVDGFLEGYKYDVARFCGETPEPVRFRPGSQLVFYVGLPIWDAQTDCPANSVKTAGKISVTISDQAAEPVRSGSILTGTSWVLGGLTGGCQASPECATWLQYGCRGALVGKNPGLTASIVDIDDLADGRPTRRTFRFGPGKPWTPVWGMVQLQFWNSDCVEMPDTRWRSTYRHCDLGKDFSCPGLLIPPDAQWMTVTSNQDSVNLAWTLY